MDHKKGANSNRSGGNGFGDDEDVNLLNAAHAQTLRYSNFFITVSTNVVPESDEEKYALAQWLIDCYQELFSSFDLMNGNLLKPPGTDNAQYAQFPNDHKIINIRSRCSPEQGQAQRGQVHCHILLEVAHRYLHQEDGATGQGNDTGKPYLGVHVNVLALREFLNARIYRMDISFDRKPKKVYVKSDLLTKGTDNSNKWLTLQYISKDRAKDNDGGVRNLRRDEIEAHDREKSDARRALLRPQAEEDVAAEGQGGPVFSALPTRKSKFF